MAAFAASSNKYFAELHLVYAYRFEYHQPKISWEIKHLGEQGSKIIDQIIKNGFYEAGKAGLADARAATLRAQKYPG